MCPGPLPTNQWLVVPPAEARHLAVRRRGAPAWLVAGSQGDAFWCWGGGDGLECNQVSLPGGYAGVGVVGHGLLL